MSISAVPATPVEIAADRTTDAALAKATAKLATDRKAGLADTVLRADQKAVATAIKDAEKADAALQPAASNVRQAATPMTSKPKSGLNVTG